MLLMLLKHRWSLRLNFKGNVSVMRFMMRRTVSAYTLYVCFIMQKSHCLYCAQVHININKEIEEEV